MKRRSSLAARRIGLESRTTLLDGLVMDYVHNLVVVGTPTEPGDGASEHFATLANNELVVKLVRDADEPSRRQSRVSNKERLSAYLASAGGAPRTPHDLSGAYGTNVRWLADSIGLDAVERAALHFLLLVSGYRRLSGLLLLWGDLTTYAAIELVAVACAVPAEHAQRALAPQGRLRQSRLVTLDAEVSSLPAKLDCKLGLLDALLTPGLDSSQLVARFLPDQPPSSMAWSDFDHLAQPAQTARELLAVALQSREPGVNILFFGPSGTGKTALARLIARELKVRLYAAEHSLDDHESGADERLSSLMLGHNLLRNAPALLLFDELEDLFTWSWHGLSGERARGAAQVGKQWFNKLLETNPVPTLWITNETSGIDPAFLRRFMYVVEFRPLGPRQRAGILTRHLGPDTRLTPDELQLLAARYRVSPAQVASAVRAARLLSPESTPDRALLERVLGPTEKLVHDADGDARDDSPDLRRYEVAALNASEDLQAIADQLQGWQPGPAGCLSLCLYGPPGTGKSEYVRYLAHRMGRPVLQRRASDILRPYVGQTELNIAGAFRQAQDEDALLLFDEVDSFLRDRRGAARSWEVTQVNEFLQQLEAYRGVVVCTTNLWQDIDQAALRRFVLKVELRYAEPEQALALFERTFGLELGADERARLRSAFEPVKNLAAGDFAAVARRVGALGGERSVRELLELVLAEARAKPATKRGIGFRG